MTNIQKKILEAVGVLSRNRLRLSTFSQNHIFDVTEGLDIIKVPSFICTRDKECLVLAESWFRERGLYLSWGTIGGTVILGFFLYIALVLPWTVERDLGIMDALILPLMGCLGFLFSFPLVFAAKGELKNQGLQYAVFNQRTKNIHYVSDVDFNTRTCRWDECTFCLAYSAGGIEGNYYELKGYLLDQEGSVRDSFSFDDYYYMPSNSATSRQAMIDDLTARFEYVRRFMEEGAEAKEPVRGGLDLTPTLSEAAHRFQPRSTPSDGKVAHVIYSLVRVVFLVPFSVQVVGHYFFCRYCRLPTWPQSVIDECGEDIFPKR
ncbi:MULTISPECIES: hypothetical protein [unclassified Halomonas]|uniref:hypothetical protein n=1 Tax=unclassified Halomonas TaxID=2609666 RepID=UPI001C942212|nr:MULTISPECIES: hypothetical protein [unclassified Halomonas]MBY5924406.1 hypothetical protein [Halomonas sp. DP4Y7-2]MBY6231448.1 hypothetical protein [Halomonas sp. DP4Y7-1]